MSGHRLPLVTITPFSVLKSSFGRPWCGIELIVVSFKCHVFELQG